MAVGKGIGNGGMIDRESAEDFAREWEKAWNAHDLEEILSHYSEDFQMTIPFIPTTMDEATGTLKKAKTRLASTGLKLWTVTLS